jgi:PadR family transcriptional regulator, regulatory protein PadR
MVSTTSENDLTEFDETILFLVGNLGKEAYALRTAMELDCRSSVHMPIGKIHSVMNKLEETGFLSSNKRKSVSHGRHIRIYRLTKKGKVRFTGIKSIISEVLTDLCFR